MLPTAPAHSGISVHPVRSRFIRSPISPVVSYGNSKAKDEEGETVSVVPVEGKKGKGKVMREELLIKKAVEEEKVLLRTDVLGDEEAGSAGKKAE